MSYSILNITSDIDLNSGNNMWYSYYTIDASSGNINITLPSISYDGYYIVFNRIDNVTANTVSLIASSGDTVGGSASKNMNVGNYCEIVSQGTNYYAPVFSYN